MSAPGSRPLGDDRLWRYLTLTPAVVVLVALTVLPIANMAAMSFFQISWAEGRAIWTPVGTQNYSDLASDNLFRAGLRNTFLFVIAAVAAQIVIGFFLALMISRIQRGRTLYRAIFLLPILIPGIVIGAIWKLMYNFDFGIINQFISLLGFMPQDWLGQQSTALLSVIVVDVWHWTPFCFLLLLAGIQSLPEDVFEAARIDGASGWQELWLIILPMMWPTIIVTAVFRLAVAFKVFDEVFLLTGGGPGTATEVLSFTIYQRFFTEDRVGYGSALANAAIFLASLLLILTLAARRREASS